MKIKDYDELFCLSVKEDKILVHKDIKELLAVFIRQYPNDRELGKFIRQHYS